MWLKSLSIGNIQVHSLTDGKFRLDGGAMFGTVPKVLWSKLTPSDELNRIQLRINPLLIQTRGKNILVETGMFEGDEKFNSMFALERDETVFSGLAALGLTPEDIHIVINTHLHFDHAGRNVTEGKPTFKHATYITQRQEMIDAHNTHERSRASYYTAQYVEPVLEAGLYQEVIGEAEIITGVKVVPVPGHNLGQQAVIVESEGETLVYTADLCPTFAHTPYPYVMGYDLYPVTTLDTKKLYFPQWAEQKAVIATPHDPLHAFAIFEAAPKGGFTAKTF